MLIAIQDITQGYYCPNLHPVGEDGGQSGHQVNSKTF